jgi:peroxiredoxin (alkyl hydroperoxide reductase subunit C)
MKEEASTESQVRPFPQIGQEAPDFEARSNRGDIRLSDYRGRWVILFSHPADFTPVCTTEFIAFAEIYEELRKRDVELIGLSIDSIYSHIAWVRNIEEKMKVKIPFPIIADLDMKVSRLYGMIHPGESTTASVRSVFFIDPEGRIRAIIITRCRLGEI